MGLEVATYINGLNAAWPLAGDTKSQGDDHLRLLKGTLQATFPNASKPFYLPSFESSAAAMILDATDQNNIIGVNTDAGDIGVTLPSALTSNDKGWECTLYRTGTDPITSFNAIVVSPSSGLISTPYGQATSVRIERPREPTRFIWNGTNFLAFKPGPLIGSSVNWDGPTVPPGYRIADGTVYSSATLVELNLALGTTTLRDKRGRVEAGVDGGIGRLTSSYFAAATLGAVGGFEYNVLSVSTMPVHAHGYSDPGHGHSVSHNANLQNASSTTGGGAFSITASSAASIVVNAAATNISIQNNGSGGAHANVQPTIITNKLIRVC